MAGAGRPQRRRAGRHAGRAGAGTGGGREPGGRRRTGLRADAHTDRVSDAARRGGARAGGPGGARGGRCRRRRTRRLALLFRPSVQPYPVSWFRHDPARLLGATSAPVLLVHGARDVQVPPAHAQLLHDALPQARLRIVPGMDHLLAVEGDVARGVALVAGELTGWLQDLPQPESA
ncbi:hypothetical protein HK414_09620 [Ramlibacter terrae]|uniref:Peptidase S33 tripeptidyl aminopeptidase-like C-terminal domain-containing protein n=1 Tax=Ramlibacter terrae TaxID=2732511 RepID=A0ABX6P8U6_9BURK|nr:hypothetical protein HK414_09620 [Ramlibacter terrae]